jgi:hypothetical protein
MLNMKSYPSKPSKQSRKRWLALLALGSSLLPMGAAHAFSGEDPVFGNPWHHEQLSSEAAKAAGFSDIRTASAGTSAAASIAWHADYVDSYLYNPMWWVEGGLPRFRVALMTQSELEKLHFDDLFSAPKVHDAWKRYALGTFAGLMWAKEKNDVAAAQNIIGASLHAVQDFYSHSNWIDQPVRRDKTYFDLSANSRQQLAIYTGAYEHSDNLGVKHHGKFLPSGVVWKQPGVSQVMDVACSAISPMTKSEMCNQYRLSKSGVTVQPQVKGITIPKHVLTLAPPGIALDNTWIAPIGVQQRGLRDLNGRQAFDIAYGLAKRQSEQWLVALGKAMKDAGPQHEAFWRRVQTEGTSKQRRTLQYESYKQFPYMFMTAGPYPNGDADGIYLRLNIKTSNASMAGTDADILVQAEGRSYVLDWGRGVNVALSYNDFEKGDDDAYIVGPFKNLPSQITLKNNAPGGGAVLKGLGNDFVRLVTTAVNSIGSMALSIIGGHADHVATNKIVWMPENLANVSAAGTPFSVRLNGGGEGDYEVYGRITRTRSDATNDYYSVRLDRFYCRKESAVDRGSNSDEPFTLAVLNPLPGNIQKFRTSPAEDVDTGESRNINHTFGEVAIPKNSGILTLALSQYESDSETQNARNQLLDKFAGKVDEQTRNVKSEFLRAIGEGAAADWKVDAVEIFAFDRRGNGLTQLQAGTVYNDGRDFELEGGKSRVLRLNTGGFAKTGVLRSVLLNENRLLDFLSPTKEIELSDAMKDRLQTGDTKKAETNTDMKKIPDGRTIPDTTRIPDKRPVPVPTPIPRKIPDRKQLPKTGPRKPIPLPR